MNAEPFTLNDAGRSTGLARAAEHLPTPTDIAADPKRCWTAILNTATGIDDPTQAPLFLRASSATIDNSRTVPEVRVVFTISSPVAAGDARTPAQVGDTGLFTTWSDAAFLITAAVGAIRGGSDLGSVLRQHPGRLTDSNGEPVDPATVAAVLQGPAELAAALRGFCAGLSRRALNHTSTVAGKDLTLLQVLHVHDGLWQPEPTIADVQRLLQEAGADTAVTDLPAFLAELDTAATSVKRMLRHDGDGIFSYQDGDATFHRLRLLPYAPTTGAVIPTIWEQLFLWGHGQGTFTQFTTQVNFDEKNYALALSGLDFDPEYYPSKKFILASVLDSVQEAAADETEWAEVEALRQRVAAEADVFNGHLPTLADIVSLGMSQARAAGDGDWVGRRGLAAHQGLLRLRFVLPEPAGAVA